MRINNDTLYDGYVDGSLTTNAYDLSHMTLVSITATLSGGHSPVGSLKLQGCNDSGRNGSVLTNWFDITAPVSSVSAVSDDGSTTWNYTNIGYKWIRLVYTRSSGFATFLVRCNVKGF